MFARHGARAAHVAVRRPHRKEGADRGQYYWPPAQCEHRGVEGSQPTPGDSISRNHDGLQIQNRAQVKADGRWRTEALVGIVATENAETIEGPSPRATEQLWIAIFCLPLFGCLKISLTFSLCVTISLNLYHFQCFHRFLCYFRI